MTKRLSIVETEFVFEIIKREFILHKNNNNV